MEEKPKATCCDFCGTSFRSRNAFFAHLQSEHGVERTSSRAKPAVAKVPKSSKKTKPPPFRSLPFLVCSSGFWYQPAYTEPPAPKAPLKGVEIQATKTSDPRRVATSSTVLRTLLCAEATEWIRSLGMLPRRCHVITSLPDISEFSPRLSSAEYEAWFTDCVTALLSRLHENSVAIFYQTDGRTGGVDGAWLDKGFLCTLGARAAGCSLCWHRIVQASSPLQVRNGRPGFARLLCFSRRHRCSVAGVDVLPSRGYMSYGAAAGEGQESMQGLEPWCTAPP